MHSKGRPTQVVSTTALGRRWAIAGPIRSYVRRFPINRGKGLLIRRILIPILPAKPAVFEAVLPGGGRVHLQPRETLGFATLLNGGFETAEISCAIELAKAGTTAFDVGANVGMYSVALGRAVGPDGQVISVEPDTDNVSRLRENLALNSITNVRVVEAAAGEDDQMVELRLADDRAYNSVVQIEAGHSVVDTATVPSVRLDQVWEDLGCPAVSFLKIDVEGAEALVLRGARAMMRAAYPAVLVEANHEANLALLRSELEPLGYRRSSREGFHRWNHLFLRAEPS
jgi:FkbM family methyltransferase